MTVPHSNKKTTGTAPVVLIILSFNFLLQGIKLRSVKKLTQCDSKPVA